MFKVCVSNYTLCFIGKYVCVNTWLNAVGYIQDICPLIDAKVTKNFRMRKWYHLFVCLCLELGCALNCALATSVCRWPLFNKAWWVLIVGVLQSSYYKDWSPRSMRTAMFWEPLNPPAWGGEGGEWRWMQNAESWLRSLMSVGDCLSWWAVANNNV